MTQRDSGRHCTERNLHGFPAPCNAFIVNILSQLIMVHKKDSRVKVMYVALKKRAKGFKKTGKGSARIHMTATRGRDSGGCQGKATWD